VGWDLKKGVLKKHGVGCVGGKAWLRKLMKKSQKGEKGGIKG